MTGGLTTHLTLENQLNQYFRRISFPLDHRLIETARREFSNLKSVSVDCVVFMAKKGVRLSVHYALAVLAAKRGRTPYFTMEIMRSEWPRVLRIFGFVMSHCP